MKPKLWRQHQCPPDIEITVSFNGMTVIGPITGENLVRIARYSGAGDGPLNLLEYTLCGRIESVDLYVKCLPPKKR